MALPTVTAGLKWPPETYPKASIAAVSARPAASEAESGFDCGMVNSGTPRPATTTNSVPSASADSRATSPGGVDVVRGGGWTFMESGQARA